MPLDADPTLTDAQLPTLPHPRVVTAVLRSQQQVVQGRAPVHVPYRDSQLTYLLQVGQAADHHCGCLIV